VIRALLLPAWLAACSESGSVELRWTVQGQAPGGQPAACAAAGVDAVAVLVLAGGAAGLAGQDGGAGTSLGGQYGQEVFACRAGAGRVHGIAPETYDLFVYGLAPDGAVRMGPVTLAGVEVRDDEVTRVDVAADLRLEDSR
jgi:hypothetical protein